MNKLLFLIVFIALFVALSFINKLVGELGMFLAGLMYVFGLSVGMVMGVYLTNSYFKDIFGGL